VDNYLDLLNDSQRAAVEYLDGPQLVIAGAGSGKTRVLTSKVAYLLQNGYEPDRIMALTFTKKAANEMKERIAQLVGPSVAARLWMGTFHSIFSRILRREAEAIDFQPDFTIYDQADSRNLVKAIIREMQLDEKVYKPNAVQGQISTAKNNLITPHMYSGHQEWLAQDSDEGRAQFHLIYQKYWQRCFQARAMDFDDLLLYTNILFRDHPEILEKYQEHFRYLLVDEYQDTNRAQHLIVEQLVRPHGHLCVVGDDAQSIYSFRGANIANILKLQQSIPGTELFKLERNYRSTQNIVEAANSLIRANREQIPKTIYSEKDRGSLLSVTGTYSDLEEAYSVSATIARLHDAQGYAYSDCAILYRTNAQSRAFEEALRKRGIAYRIYGGLSFYQRKEIKDIIAYLRLIVNPADEEAFKRVINYPPRGIGETTISKLADAAGQYDRPFFDICMEPEAFQLPVNRGTAAKLAGFVEFINHYADLSRSVDAYDLTRQLLVDAGIQRDLNADTTPEGMSRLENVNELLGAIQTFVTTAVEEGRADEATITDFLSDVSLSGDVEPEESEDEPVDCVTLMTIHASKGLEFKNIFVVGVEDGLIPSDMCGGNPKGIEEERRLFYVAITRAEENCFLSYATSRFRNGRSDVSHPSRFLKDIDARYLKRSDAVRRASDSFSSYGGSFGGGSFGGASSSFKGSSYGGSSAKGGSSYGGSSYGSTSSGSSSVSSKGSTSRPSIFGGTVDVPSPSRPAKPTSSVLDFTGRVHKMTSPEKIQSSDVVFYQGRPLRSGMMIEHERFGFGVITEVLGADDDARIRVKFGDEATKTLLLKFAKIHIVD
jgi:DNA helicase-2/ATP-dependent DNA helicase PcrA